jgi:hypothetical protein
MKKLTLILLIFYAFTSMAQDKIVKKTGDVIDCKVTEVGASEIKYYYQDNSKLIFGIDKSLVEKIEFSTGEVVKIKSDSFNDPEYYSNQSKHALKINFLSPFKGSTEFAYEQSIKPGRSWETSLGIVGLGFDPNDRNPAGAYARFAYKFIKTPDFYMNNMHYSHILKGAYFAPEFAMRYMEYDSFNYFFDNSGSHANREEDYAFALLLKVGKQWVLDDAFVIDMFIGMGYGISSASENDPVFYGFFAGTEDSPISFTSGVRIGWAF